MRGLVHQVKVQEFKALHPGIDMSVAPSLLMAISDLTSRGVPALFNNFTTACTPLTSSNVRSAVDESTSTQSKVSRIAEERWAIEDVFSDNGLEIELSTDDGVITDVCREVVKSATRTYNATQHQDEHPSSHSTSKGYRRPRYTLLAV